MLNYLFSHDIIVEGENLKINKKVKQNDYAGGIYIRIMKRCIIKMFSFILRIKA